MKVFLWVRCVGLASFAFGIMGIATSSLGKCSHTSTGNESFISRNSRESVLLCLYVRVFDTQVKRNAEWSTEGELDKPHFAVSELGPCHCCGVLGR